MSWRDATKALLKSHFVYEPQDFAKSIIIGNCVVVGLSD